MSRLRRLQLLMRKAYCLLLTSVKAIDRIGTDKVKFNNSWTTCDMVMNFGRIGPWEVLHLAWVNGKMWNLPRTKPTKIHYNIISRSAVIRFYLISPSLINGLHISSLQFVAKELLYQQGSALISGDIVSTFFLSRDTSQQYETKVERETKVMVAPYLDKLGTLLYVSFKFVRSQDVSKVILFPPSSCFLVTSMSFLGAFIGNSRCILSVEAVNKLFVGNHSGRHITNTPVKTHIPCGHNCPTDRTDLLLSIKGPRKDIKMTNIILWGCCHCSLYSWSILHNMVDTNMCVLMHFISNTRDGGKQ